MNALLLTAALAAAQPPAAGQPATRGTPDRAAAANTMDGTWTVVAFERNGSAVPNAANMTATLRNNTVTFAGGENRDAAAGVRAMTLAFGPGGTVRVSETDAPAGGAATGASATQPGRSDAGAGGGSGPPTGSTTGTRPGGATISGGSSDLPAGDAARSGVYVMTRDYLVIAIHDDMTRTGPSGAGNTGVSGTGSTARGTGTGGTNTGRADAPATPATGTDAAATGTAVPQARSFMTVILRRSDTGTGGTPSRQ